MREDQKNSDYQSRKFTSLRDRIKKDARGALSAILILSIIRMEGRTWGYHIKKQLGALTANEFQIKDSSLYTILNNLEEKYKLIQSIKEKKLRYYSLTEQGLVELQRTHDYWHELVAIGNKVFEKMIFLQTSEIKEKR
ncbi:MAG: PadR family transcriptional regulator [Candidatus Hodarchaeales archaeon]|jgi:DNA-binding PadR family transcriptional regulator